MGVSGQLHTPDALCPHGRTPDTNRTGGLVGATTGLDTGARGKIFFEFEFEFELNLNLFTFHKS
jgi:hypothetical protein